MLREALIVTLAAAAVLPSAASASVLTYEGPTDNEILILRGAPGEADRVGIQLGPIADSVSLYDPNHQITQVPEQCAQTSNSVDCHAPNGARFELGDGNDDAYMSSDVTVAVTMLGGPGDDQLAGNGQPQTLLGDSGNDKVKGSGGDDVLDGGDGDDTLDGYAGADRITGGAGDDLIYPDGYETPAADVVDGGAGVDRIESDYITRDPDAPQPPSSFTLAGGADDGRPGEGDDIRNVERFTLSKAARFVGTDAPEYVKLHQVSGNGDLSGMGGDDELRGGDGIDAIDGGAGDDVLDGGYGDDAITGGSGRDTISADLSTGDCGPLWCKYPYGNDVVQARDGEVDSVTCGAGTDRVVADADDVVAPDCETVERGATPAVAGGPALAPGQHLRAALRTGLRVTLGSMAPIKVRALRGARTVAKGKGRDGVAVLRFTKAARGALKRKRSVKLTIVAGSARATVKLKR